MRQFRKCYRYFANLAIVTVLSSTTGLADPASASVFDRVKAAGVVRCAVDQTPGFSNVDDSGRAFGFDVDFCRAVAAAVLGDANAIQTQRISTANKFKALTAGEIDIAFGMATWTFSRDTAMGTRFPATIFFDGQGFLTWGDTGIKGLADLGGHKICVQSATTSEANLKDLLRRRRIEAEVLLAASTEEKFAAFVQKQCDVVTGDRSELAARRAALAGQGGWVLLGETISREPLGPVVAEGDDRWFAIVRWVVYATLLAEAEGLTSETIEAVDQGADGEARRLAGLEADFGTGLGLDAEWARRVITQVGNYAEIFDRNVGAGSRTGLERGQNALWLDGGLHYPPALR